MSYEADHAHLMNGGDLAYDPDCPRCRIQRQNLMTTLRVPLPPYFQKEKPVPDWPYFVFWASSLTGLFILMVAIILGLKRVIELLEDILLQVTA